MTKMDNGWKALIIIALALSIISVFASATQRIRTTTTTNRVYLETKIVHDERYVLLSNPYDFSVYDIYLVYKLETREYYDMIQIDMLGGNISERYGPWMDTPSNLVRVVDAYAYGVKP